jgi:hypothetical protein
VVSPDLNPTNDPNNYYVIGSYRIVYSGAGETLTSSVETQNPRTSGAQAAFANAGFFAARVVQVPEPSTMIRSALGVSVAGLAAWRKHRSA